MSLDPRPLVVLAGNPNTGKSTLFNALTTSRVQVGNYPGVTVESLTASLSLPDVGPVEVMDLPGAYSLVSRSAEEQIAVEVLLGLDGGRKPSAVVVCVEASNPLRGLYVALQILELGVPALIALTMMDEAGDSAPDPNALARCIGCPVLPIAASRGMGLLELKTSIAAVVQSGTGQEEWTWQPSAGLKLELSRIKNAMPEHWPKSDAAALWALMSIGDEDELRGISSELRSAASQSATPGDEVDDEVIRARYAWLDRHVAPIIRENTKQRRRTDFVDRILISKVAGFAIFLALMFLVFQSLFAWADPAIALIESAFGWLSKVAESRLPEGLVTDFITQGIIAGMGSVVVFLPQILLLFFMIGLMEDSGYMARVAYLMDRIMKSMNLHGRAFVPMLSGFACAVPAILATRTLERRRDRLLTMMVVPLMTCSARLPVYTLLIAALFPATNVLGFFPIQGLLMVCMYVFSVVVALVAAWVLSRTMRPLKAKRLPFVIELPPYRLPRFGGVVRMMIGRTKVFLKEAGTVIFVSTLGLWVLLSFPRYDKAQSESHADAASMEASAQQSEALRQSYGGRLGRAIEPAIAPLGFDWKIGVGIVGAFAAREVFVSTMGIVYSIGDDVDENDVTLRDRIRSDKKENGAQVYTPLVALSLMVFFALACQCVSTLAVVKRETGGYAWPAFLFAYMTATAWVFSFAVYQGGRLLGFG